MNATSLIHVIRTLYVQTMLVHSAVNATLVTLEMDLVASVSCYIVAYIK